MKKAGKAITSILAAAAVLTVGLWILPTVNSASPPPDSVSAETQYDAAGESMLYLRCFYASGGLKTTGSGFIIADDGLAVTAAHVIEKAARVVAIDSSGKELACEVVSSDETSDVAVLRLPTGKYKALQLAEKAPSGGATVRAMGYPIKGTLIITEGIVSSPNAAVNEKNRMMVSCDIVNGMSGGPVFDKYGKVAGVCSGSVRTMSGIHLSALWSDISSAVTAAQSSKQ